MNLPFMKPRQLTGPMDMDEEMRLTVVIAGA